jgi:ATP diphosphatase
MKRAQGCFGHPALNSFFGGFSVMTPQLQRLIGIMKQLRNPNGGCPWDVEQTHQSIAKYCLEEAYEVVDAIEQDDMASLREELGDLLLQVVFHSQMAYERGDFDIEAVAQAICDKMVRRHPHVFGDVKAEDENAVHTNWEALKAEERAAKQTDSSALADIPAAFPALLRAQKIQKRVAQVGFDWPDVAPVYDKVQEELQEVREASSDDHRAEEIGDLLFVVVNLARHYKVDAESALRAANQKFEKRFRYVEAESDKPLEQSSLEEMEALWVEAKTKA